MAVFVSLLGREERVEDLFELFSGDAAAAVSDADLGEAGLAIRGDGDQHSSAVRHRLASVDDEVQQDLLDLAGVEFRLWVLGEVGFEFDAVHLQVFLDEHQHLLDERDKVIRFAAVASAACVRQHAGRDLRGSLAGGEDFVERLVARRRVFVSQAHLRVVDDRREDVVELVSHRGREGSDGAQSLRLHQLVPQVGDFLSQRFDFGLRGRVFRHEASLAFWRMGTLARPAVGQECPTSKCELGIHQSISEGQPASLHTPDEPTPFAETFDLTRGTLFRESNSQSPRS